jgi:hypothetical protein
MKLQLWKVRTIMDAIAGSLMDGFRVRLFMQWSGLLTKQITYREYRFVEGCRRSNCLPEKAGDGESWREIS